MWNITKEKVDVLDIERGQALQVLRQYFENLHLFYINQKRFHREAMLIDFLFQMRLTFTTRIDIANKVYNVVDKCDSIYVLEKCSSILVIAVEKLLMHCDTLLATSKSSHRNLNVSTNFMHSITENN